MGTVRFPVKTFLGVQSVSVSDRLKEERKRLDLSQTTFGQIGGVTKKTQMLYENGERLPDAAYLRGISGIGADVQYILIGLRSANLDEAMLSDEFIEETNREHSLSIVQHARPVPALNKALLLQIMEAVEEALPSHKKAIAPEKKAELIFVLYEHFAPKGKIVEEEFRSYLKLVA